MKLGLEIAHHLDIFTNLLHHSINIGVCFLIRFKRFSPFKSAISFQAILVNYQHAHNM